MKFEVDTQIPYGNACDIGIRVEHDTTEVSFAPAPHGGPETLWFCLRVRRAGDIPATGMLRLVLKHHYNVLGGHTPSAMRPVIRYQGRAWQRLPQGDLVPAPDGRTDVAWLVGVPEDALDVAFCYPYGVEDVEALVAETDGTWRVDTIGVSQGARPLVRLSNGYGGPGDGRPGLYVIARQHSGETPGSWVLDGFLRMIAELGPEAPLVWAVPLSNIDGVVSGDYGKDNFPYDLNRAWGRPPMRHEVSVFQRDMARWRSRCRPLLGIDFHAPGACETGGVYTYIPDPDTDRAGHDAVMPWALLTEDALIPEYAADQFARVVHYPSRWDTPSFRTYVWTQLGLPCITFETPYAMAGTQVLSQADYREIGRRIVQGIVAGIKQDQTGLG